jgi:predicted esterase
MTALDEETCYVLPEGKPTKLLVYLHGITPPLPASPQKTTVQTAVRNAALRAQAAAIVPRGRRGIGPAGAKDWWAWPTSPGAHAELAPGIVAQWKGAKAKLEAIVGAPFARTYLAGSSNGAYFVAALALRGDPAAMGFPIDGYGAMSGGASGGIAGRGPGVRFYVGYGTYDEETKRHARSLVATLEAARWPHRVSELPYGHGAREAYLDEGFRFWDK